MKDSQKENASPKYKDQYRISSARLPICDYSSAGYYFVTICTQDRKSAFGQVIDEEMILSEIGQIARTYWLEIPHHHQNVEMDMFCVMPNHFHGIIIKLDPQQGGDLTSGRDVAVQRFYYSNISP